MWSEGTGEEMEEVDHLDGLEVTIEVEKPPLETEGAGPRTDPNTAEQLNLTDDPRSLPEKDQRTTPQTVDEARLEMLHQLFEAVTGESSAAMPQSLKQIWESLIQWVRLIDTTGWRQPAWHPATKEELMTPEARSEFEVLRSLAEDAVKAWNTHHFDGAFDALASWLSWPDELPTRTPESADDIPVNPASRHLRDAARVLIESADEVDRLAEEVERYRDGRWLHERTAP